MTNINTLAYQRVRGKPMPPKIAKLPADERQAVNWARYCYRDWRKRWTPTIYGPVETPFYYNPFGIPEWNRRAWIVRGLLWSKSV